MTSQLSGVVLDGYLVGAKVCLDLNANWVCDSGEPSAITGAGGRYTLNVSPLSVADTGSKQIIAEVGPDVVDEATGTTLRAQGQDGYVLAAWGSAKPVLSAMSTLRLSSADPTTTFGRNSSDAMATLLRDSGFSDTELDYFDASANLSDAARDLAKQSGRVLTALLAQTQKRLRTDLGELYGTQSESLGLRTATLLTQALKDTRPSGAMETEADQLTRVSAQMRATPLVLDQEKAERIKPVALTVSEAQSTLSIGIHDVNLFGASPRSYVRFKASGLNGSLTTTGVVWRNASWQVDSTYQSNGANGYRVPFNANASDPQSNAGVISIASTLLNSQPSQLQERFTNDSGAPQRELIVQRRDISGLNFSAIPGLASMSGSFGSGALGFRIQRRALRDEYVFDKVATFFTTLSAFKNSPRTCFGGICWSITKQATGATADLAGTMAFTTTSANGSLQLGTASFVEENVQGVSVLRMLSIPMEVQNRSADWSLKDGRYPLFAEWDNKLWAGRFTPANTVWFSNWLLDITALNSLLASASLGAALP
ncbi:hypothetical protein [Curvibacter sp. AEP1-3]|uniref:hypothetical protein n=1 Tax=Curvibacter sp. AEP1-3 TaxID=1844971 RepID=UPI0012FC250C|nr:hypothetical protein [Curvibacter sp. AEP1-3]